MPSIDRLTGREREILHLVSEHLTNREIARELTLAESTVETHMHRILRKLRSDSRHHAARLYLNSGSSDRNGKTGPP